MAVKETCYPAYDFLVARNFMKNYKDKIEKKYVPKHVALIMDGNGRWAKNKSLPRIDGHRKGAGVIEPLMDAAIELGVKAVSLYAFSTENWSRPKDEIRGLWKLLNQFFEDNIEKIKANGIRIQHSGTMKRLPKTTKKTILNAIEETKKNRKIVLNFCINYGGKQEIADGINKWLEKRKPGEVFTPKKMDKYLYTTGLPAVDLLIRTSGELRISNFLIWQIAYAELIFMDVLWPDFKPVHLYKAIYDYQQRERRFGGI